MLCPPFVDVAMEQLGVALIAGATLVLASAEPWSPVQLPDLIAEQGITALDISPLAWRDMLDRLTPGDPRLNTLRLVNVGSDVVHLDDARRWFALRANPAADADTGGEARFVASYGPTEAVVTTSLHWADRDTIQDLPEQAVMPIGVEVAGKAGYVLDDGLNSVTAAAPGELYLGGAQLARGYLGQPALTAQRFVPDPFATKPGARMYRTGDRVSRRSDGVLDFLGRLDRQVKVNGFRVELGEIEACLLAHPRIQAACVLADPQLTAYVVPAGSVQLDELRAHVRENLPGYMTPAYWSLMDRLPLTPSGKVDMKGHGISPGAGADQGGCLPPRQEGRNAGTGRPYLPGPPAAAPGFLRRQWRHRAALPPDGRGRHAILHHD
jgi:acyl-CoA synthetase (AMP-forming)/AMP-acid ligase II